MSERDIVERLQGLGIADAYEYGLITSGQLAERLIRERQDSLAEILHLRTALAEARDALTHWDALIRFQYSGSREAMSAMQECAFETDAILKGQKP